MKNFKLTEGKKDIIAGYIYIYILPALIFMLVLIGYPIIYNFIISFQDLNAMNISNGIRKFIGFGNYKKVLSDEVMTIAFKNTLIYTFASLAFQFTIGFALAIFFSNKFRLAKPIRGFMVISYMMPITVTALMFKFMLSPSNGIINDIMMGIGIINKPIPWLLQESTALWGVIMANSWIGIPFNMLLLTTGLSNIPEEIYESAAVDGANGFRKFINITLPLLKPAILSVLMLGFVYTFKVFDLVFVMTSGGPVNSTEVLSTFSYRLSFKYYYFGQGAAVANILFLCLFAVALVYLKLIGKEDV
ncbi:MAG: sugar ABC transporter permease [Epulopiscium sp.]|nr:sugar ABC transporter permease [Candidatus Epulonipiscium sp.]